jgi:hypothetical protein
MSRSGYSDDCENVWLWRGAVVRSLKGKRGQRALRDIAEALDAMPEKKLGSNSFGVKGAECCTLGALAVSRGVDMTDLEPESDPDGWTAEVDRDVAGHRLDIAPAMVAEVMFMNDEGSCGLESPEERWIRMRVWVAARIGATQERGGSNGDG